MPPKGQVVLLQKIIIMNAIIFDLGGVLIDWNPAYLYSKIFLLEEDMQHFLQQICTSDWNEEQDAGRTIKEATDLLIEQHPKHEENIRAFYGRWPEMLGGAIEPVVTIFSRLKETNSHKFYALTNWSVETFPIAQQRFNFLTWFDGIVVSGEEKTRKPFANFYHILLKRYNLEPNEVLFIDDNLRNIKAAKALGMNVIHFETADLLEQRLVELNLL